MPLSTDGHINLPDNAPHILVVDDDERIRDLFSEISNG